MINEVRKAGSVIRLKIDSKHYDVFEDQFTSTELGKIRPVSEAPDPLVNAIIALYTKGSYPELAAAFEECTIVRRRRDELKNEKRA